MSTLPKGLLLPGIGFCVSILAGCANPHFFPRTRPLFAGLDESHVPPRARQALAEAKVDFQLARADRTPRYAHLLSVAPYSNSKTYEGRGYHLTIVHDYKIAAHSDGPEILLESHLTGGKPYRYSEVDEVVD